MPHVTDTATAPKVNAYRKRVFKLIADLLQPLPRFGSALDFGAGDGWFAHSMEAAGFVENVTALEVVRRPATHHQIETYDGSRLPLNGRTFPLVYVIDVLHHCESPLESLAELAEASSQYFLIKDHTHTNRLGWLALAALDEIGNRRFGISCIHHYQRGFEWNDVLQRNGFTMQKLIYPAPCHLGLYGEVINGFEYLALWRRSTSAKT